MWGLQLKQKIEFLLLLLFGLLGFFCSLGSFCYCSLFRSFLCFGGVYISWVFLFVSLFQGFFFLERISGVVTARQRKKN